MTHRVYNADRPVAFTCVDHPAYEGSRQTQAYLDGCLGCRAVYAVRKARSHVPAGLQVPILRVALDTY